MLKNRREHNLIKTSEIRRDHNVPKAVKCSRILVEITCASFEVNISNAISQSGFSQVKKAKFIIY